MPRVNGHALIDRELYLPQPWTEDRYRCRAAGIPDEAEFAIKPRLAQAMLARAIDAGMPLTWFTADETSGAFSCQAAALCVVSPGAGKAVVSS